MADFSLIMKSENFTRISAFFTYKGRLIADYEAVFKGKSPALLILVALIGPLYDFFGQRLVPYGVKTLPSPVSCP